MAKIMMTGAGSGLSRGAAFELASRGHEVIACVADYPQLRAMEIAAKQKGAAIRIEKLDVTSEGDRRRAAGWDVDVLVNGAGIIEGGAIVDLPIENLRRQLEVNVVGPVALTRGIARRMVERGCGKVVFVSSVVGIITGPFVGAYAASKFALEAIAQTMATELQEFGVEVATINPGAFLTGFNDAGFLTPRGWDDDPAERVFDYDQLSFPFEQYPEGKAFASMADAIEAEDGLFRNVITPDLADGVRQAAEGVWSRRTRDGLGKRADLVQTAYDIAPETLVRSD